MRHIVVVTDTATVNGGSGKVAVTSAVALAKAGIAVTLFTAQGPIDPELSSITGLRVICLNQSDILSNPNRANAAMQGIWNTQAFASMQSLLRELDGMHTIVHVHSWTKAHSSSVIAAALRAKFQVVVTLHDYFSACPIGSFYDHGSRSICTLKPMSAACIARPCDSRSYPQKLWRVVRQGVQSIAAGMPHHVKHFITISEFSKAILRPLIDHDDATFYDVANPIDTEQRECIRPSAVRRFLFIGRLSSEKGPQLFAEATGRCNVDAAVVGDGELRVEMQRINPRIDQLGWQPAAIVHAQMRVSRALVFPSLWYENSPLSVLEAAAHGLPAIVPDTSAARDQVHDGETGIIFRGGDAESLGRAIRRIADDDALADRLGKAAYTRFWETPPSMHRHVEQLLSVYNHVAANNDPTSLNPPTRT